MAAGAERLRLIEGKEIRSLLSFTMPFAYWAPHFQSCSAMQVVDAVLVTALISSRCSFQQVLVRDTH